MKTQTRILTAVVAVATLLLSFYFTTLPRLKKIDSFGNHQIGSRVITFSGVTDSGIHHTHIDPPGQFHILLITNTLPNNLISCLDEECGPQSQLIKKYRGHLLATRDLKLGGLYGIKTRRPDGSAAFDHSLAIVSDSQGVILSLFKNAELSNLQELMQESGLSHL